MPPTPPIIIIKIAIVIIRSHRGLKVTLLDQVVKYIQHLLGGLHVSGLKLLLTTLKTLSKQPALNVLKTRSEGLCSFTFRKSFHTCKYLHVSGLILERLPQDLQQDAGTRATAHLEGCRTTQRNRGMFLCSYTFLCDRS